MFVKMFNLKVILILITVFEYSKGSNLLPRGISLAQRLLYEPLEGFTCLDGSKILPFTYVNDDYCDCPDGSDEPGTSACPNGVFHCQNVGYIAVDIPASRVNDLICDCCDGSDEYLYGNCTDVCQSSSEEAKQAAARLAEEAARGIELRAIMIADAKQIRRDTEDRLAALEVEKLEATRLKEEASLLKDTAEAAEFAAIRAYRDRQNQQKLLAEKLETEKLENEASEVFKQLDSNHDEILGPEELQRNYVFDWNNDGQITDEDLLHCFETTNGTIDWSTFLKSWPKLKARKDGKNTTDHSEQDKNVNEAKKEDYSSSIKPTAVLGGENLARNDGEEKERDVIEEKNTEYDNEGEMEQSDASEEEDGGEEANPQEWLHAERTVEENDNYDEETVNVIRDADAARDKYKQARRSLQDVEKELTRIQRFLFNDYGEDDEYMTLAGQCFSYWDRHYNYTLCPFNDVVQMTRAERSRTTRLGSWAGWQDETNQVMIYNKGETCWDGPERTAKVTLICGPQNAVISAAEPTKCGYELIFQTPAQCKPAALPQTTTDHTHEEL